MKKSLLIFILVLVFVIFIVIFVLVVYIHISIFKVQVKLIVFFFILLADTFIICRLKRVIVRMGYLLLRAVIRLTIRGLRVEMVGAHDAVKARSLFLSCS